MQSTQTQIPNISKEV